MVVVLAVAVEVVEESAASPTPYTRGHDASTPAEANTVWALSARQHVWSLHEVVV